ncbi:50S ribosomal protein L10 [Candidatus Parcubacteria bacterium]|nr:MAG: 50S ribosomal protein L10 [Candidatus Parcubacteria bacterium]
MPKTKEQKQEILQALKDKISRSKSVIFTKFDGLGVKENEELRGELGNENNEYFVAKKTLLDIAFKDSKVDGLDVKSFDGRVAAVFGYDDEVSPAKVVDKFISSHEGKVEFVGGILENKFMGPDSVKQLAGLPSKQELYAKIVGSINAPVSGFVNVLAGNLRGLVTVLKAFEEKK